MPPTTEPTTTTTEAPTTTTEAPPIPTTTEPPIQEPTTTTTEAPPIPTTTEPPIQEPSTTTTEPPVTEEPGDPDDGDDGDAVVVPADDGDAPSGEGTATGSPLPAVSGDSTADDSGDDEVALPSAEWLFSDGRALVSPPETGQTDTRPLWVAVLLGLAAGIGLTATASVVSNNLHREHPES